jgi:hypothetical protein
MNQWILRATPAALLLLALGGCAYPSNVVNDVKHMGDPAYDACRSGADPTTDYGARCAHEADPAVQAEKAEEARQAAEQQRVAAPAVQQRLADRQEAELARGYSPITVSDFVLDGKRLAARKAKHSLTGIYMPVGDMELLFQSSADAYMFSNGQSPHSPNVNLLTEDASRQFRSQLLACRSSPAAQYAGCQVHILGTVTMCVLSDPTGRRRDVPCVSVEDGSIGRP